MQDYTNLKRPKGGPVYSLTDWEWKTFLKVRDKYNERLAGMDPSSLDAIMLMAEAARDYAAFIEEKRIKHFNQRTDNGADHEKVVESAKEELDGYLVVELRTIVNRREKPSEYAAKWRLQILQELNDVVDMHLKALAGDEESKKRITDYIPMAFNNAFPILMELRDFRAPSVRHIHMALDNLTRSLFSHNYKSTDDSYEGKKFPVKKWEGIPIRYESKGKEAIFLYMIDYGGNSPIPLGAFEEAVMDAFGSLAMQSEKLPAGTSADMVGRVLLGRYNDPNPKPIPKALAADITQAVDSLTRFIEISEYNSNDPRYRRAKTPLLNASIIETNQPITINGTQITGSAFIIHGMPATWAFAQKDPKHLEISTRDITLLDIPGMNATKESVTLRFILIKRVTKMRHDYDSMTGKGKVMGLNQRCITLEWLRGAMGYQPKDKPEAEKRQKQEFNKKVSRILDYWTERGFIAGYRFIKDKTIPGNPYTSIEIKFPEGGIKAQGGAKKIIAK